VKANLTPESSAVPAAQRVFEVRAKAGGRTVPRVIVLDTGLARAKAGASRAPALIANAASINGSADAPDANGDGLLDVVAGHGTFIAGILEQLVPGCEIKVNKVIDPNGTVAESKLVAEILSLAGSQVRGRRRRSGTFLNLSLGGQVLALPFLLRFAVANAARAGITVVASAGNDGVCTPQYPAAFPDVIAVGALGPDGPAEFTNYGCWVDACAPGTDLVSAFFTWNGDRLPVDGVDPDDFREWAMWSGTSFSTPMVVAALCREIMTTGCDAAAAVERVIRAPHLMRIPCLGTVVNL
jgi:subtilisin family serine protease